VGMCIQQMSGPFYKLVRNVQDAEDIIKARLKRLADAVIPVEVELKRRGTLFFAGRIRHQTRTDELL